MKNLRYWAIVSVLPVLAASILVSACGKESSSSPRVTLQFGTYTAWNRWMSFLIPDALAAVSDSRFCFKRLRFKTENEGTSSDTSNDSDNVDFTPGEVKLSTSGTTLGSVVIPAGTYTRLEFDLEKDGPGCTSNKSVQVTNGSGSFSTQDRITVKFEGRFEANESEEVLALGVQNIISALDQINSDSAIKNKLEDAGVKGTF